MAGMPAAAALDTQRVPAILPNPGGSLPSDCFAGVSGRPTVRVPHSCPVRSPYAQHDPLSGPVAREGRASMTGEVQDLGTPPPHVR